MQTTHLVRTFLAEVENDPGYDLVIQPCHACRGLTVWNLNTMYFYTQPSMHCFECAWFRLLEFVTVLSSNNSLVRWFRRSQTRAERLTKVDL